MAAQSILPSPVVARAPSYPRQLFDLDTYTAELLKAVQENSTPIPKKFQRRTEKLLAKTPIPTFRNNSSRTAVVSSPPTPKHADPLPAVNQDADAVKLDISHGSNFDIHQVVHVISPTESEVSSPLARSRAPSIMSFENYDSKDGTGTSVHQKILLMPTHSMHSMGGKSKYQVKRRESIMFSKPKARIVRLLYKDSDWEPVPQEKIELLLDESSSINKSQQARQARKEALKKPVWLHGGKEYFHSSIPNNLDRYETGTSSFVSSFDRNIPPSYATSYAICPYIRGANRER